MTELFSDWVNRLALGTVQFGTDYGISNRSGKLSPAEAKKVLEKALSAGITLLDTAKTYGDSERVLGAIIGSNTLAFDIVSKLPPNCFPEQIAGHTQDSLTKLGIEKIYGFLAHSFDDFKDVRFRDAMNGLKSRGKVEKIGVSVYFPDQLEWILDSDISIDLVQLPFNVFDQRFLPVLPRLRQRNIEIHVRSIFLQGLFFLSPHTIRKRFPVAYEPYEHLKRMCKDNELPIYSALLNFGLTTAWVDKVLLGVTSSEELERNLEGYRDYDTCKRLGAAYAELSLGDENTILPFKWS